MVILGVRRDKVVEGDRRDARALRNARPGEALAGGGAVVRAAGHTPLEV